MGELENFIAWFADNDYVSISIRFRGTNIHKDDLLRIYKTGISKPELMTLAFLQGDLSMYIGQCHDDYSEIEKAKEICKKYGLNIDDYFDLEEHQKKIQQHYQDRERERTRPSNPGYVYLVQDQDKYKIGKARDVKSRISGLQTGHHQVLTLVHSYYSENNEKEERRLHKMFHDKHTRGEWFSLSEEDIAYIKSL